MPMLLFIAPFVAARLALWALATSRYGYFRDELYYFACADHLAWGYVDQPPLSIALLAAIRHTLGDSLPAIRGIAALAGVLTIACCGLLARELGGRRFAQGLAMLVALLVPLHLAISGFYSMNALDLLFWALGALLFARILKGAGRRNWILLGIVLGLGLQNKISVLWLGFGLVVGLLLTKQRRILRTPWPWLAGIIALLLFTPYIVWNAQHGWAALEFMHNASAEKMERFGYAAFIANEIVVANPLFLPVWAAGLLWLFLTPRYRALGWAFAAVFGLLLLNQTSRAAYLGPAYTIPFAAGGVAIERLAQRRAWLGPALVALTVVGGLLTLPLAVPLLPVHTFIAYQAALGVAPQREEHDALGALPQHYADMFGWPELTAAVADVYKRLPPEDRRRAGIFGHNYGEAAAIDFFGPRYGLPRAISGHNNYWLWGPDGVSGDVMVVVGAPRAQLTDLFESVELAGTVHCGECRPAENDNPIFVCRRLKRPLVDVWAALKMFI